MLPMAYFVRYRKPLPRWDASVIYGNDGLAVVPDDQRLATIKRTALYKCAKMPSYGFQIDLARVVDSADFAGAVPLRSMRSFRIDVLGEFL